MTEKPVNEIKYLTGEQFEAVGKITEKLNSAEYQDSLIEEALDIVIDAINAERGLFVKYDEDRNFSIVTARNIQKESISDLSEFSSGILKKVADSRKPLLYHDTQSDPNVSQFESIQIQNIKSVIGVPIIYSGDVWGVILADSRINRKEFNEQNLHFLNFFSHLVSLILDKIIRMEKLKDENQLLKASIESKDSLPDMIGKSKKMQQLTEMIKKVAASNATVLILGESGTGKELAARAIHKLSSRSDEPFLAQFCGSIPDNLLESELFGYKKGAFTGADTDKKGLLEVADGGTFFLDEIADISGALQAKLLRVLENKEIMRLGDTAVKKVDVRILTATNKDLRALVKEGKFREDLFYRLNVFPLKLPPLRERREDISILANHFVNELSERKVSFTDEALKKLENYFWPGNIRQLINVIQRALILREDSRITGENIVMEDEERLEDFQGTLKDYEKLLLKKRLEESGGNRTLTAKSLGVSVRWVQMKLKEMEEPDSE